ncbi:hypothetical protein ACFX2A_000330 [Malus domestica]
MSVKYHHMIGFRAHFQHLKINDNLKKEVEELQQVCACMIEENEQLKGEKVGFEASLTQNEADFYKLGHVDHLFERPFDFEFSGEDFETFFISLEDLLAFTFEFSISEVVGEVGAQVEAARNEASDVVGAAKGMATK